MDTLRCVTWGVCLKTTFSTSLIFGALIIAAACAQQGPGVGTVRPVTSRDSIYILVDNQDFLDATVYLNFLGSNRRRLGSVPGQSRREYSVRWSASEMFFVVDFVGSRLQLNSRQFAFRQGELVELRIPPNANQSGNLIITRR